MERFLRSEQKIMQLRWKNKRCTDEALRLMEQAVRRVEERQSSEQLENSAVSNHIPTAINDELYQHCLCVVVAPNASEGCCFRGMECTQFELNDRVYNIGIVLRRSLKDMSVINPVPLVEKKSPNEGKEQTASDRKNCEDVELKSNG